MSELHSKATECDYHDAERQVRQHFTLKIEDNKIQDELLAKMIHKSTPDDILKVTWNFKAQRAKNHAIENKQKQCNQIQFSKDDWAHTSHFGNAGYGGGYGGGGCGCSQSMCWMRSSHGKKIHF